MTVAIEAFGLTKWYGRLLAVDHVSFKVSKGEIFGFLGPNGAGKTTTVRMLTGMSRPSEGTARIMGFDIQREAVRAKEQIGVVPDISNIYVELTTWENLVFTGKLYGIPRDERRRRAEGLLELFDLEEKKDEPAGRLSKGMRRRLCIAMALMNNSSVLFLDEPTTGLDVQSVIKIRELIRNLNRQGLTIFLTTHNMQEANIMCDRIAIINKGRIVAVDTPERLKNRARRLQSVVVSFDRAGTRVEEDLRKLQGAARVVKEGDKYRIYTSDPSDVVQALCSLAWKQGLRIVSINTVKPSLEDIFLELTGIGEVVSHA